MLKLCYFIYLIVQTLGQKPALQSNYFFQAEEQPSNDTQNKHFLGLTLFWADDIAYCVQAWLSPEARGLRRVLRCGVLTMAWSVGARTCRTTDMNTLQVRHRQPRPPCSFSPADLTSAGIVVCGGWSTRTSCLVWAPGTSTWTSYATIQSRWSHVSFLTSTGQLVLLGGWDESGGLSSTEIVGVGPGFPLQRPTM